MTHPLTMRRSLIRYAVAIAVIVATGLTWNVFFRAPAWRSAAEDPALAAQPNTTLVRVNPDQYRQIIADIFGQSIKINGRFVEPGMRTEGLLAVGAGEMTVTSAGLDAADAIADGIAKQVFSPEFRAVLMPCTPRSPTEADEVCARKFFEPVSRLLLRRSVAPEELAPYLHIASSGAKSSNDFYAGMQMALRQMLISPDFLFRRELAKRDSKGGDYHVVGDSRASRLSFFLWNSTPDAQLLDAAAKDELDSPAGLERQVDRLMSSPRLAAGVRAFFVDLLGFDEFTILNKDATLFPQFTAQVAIDAQEQTLRTIADLLLVRDGDYRDLFTTRQTFLTPSLGALYGVPVVELAQNGAPDQWFAYEFPKGDLHAGLLTEASFVALHSHPGRTSPTSRGKALREHLLCQKVPPPPSDVDFSLLNDISNPKFKTARQRLGAHASQPTCAGCHKITDPIGLALENFDGSGVFRTAERGAPIDASGELNGVHYEGPVALGEALHGDPGVPACLVTRLFEYGTNRQVEGADLPTVRSLQSQFAARGYQIRALLKAIVMDEAFYRAPRPRRALDPAAVYTASLPAPAGRAGPLTARQ
jgi:hypothetical protein